MRSAPIGNFEKPIAQASLAPASLAAFLGATSTPLLRFFEVPYICADNSNDHRSKSVMSSFLG